LGDVLTSCQSERCAPGVTVGPVGSLLHFQLQLCSPSNHSTMVGKNLLMLLKEVSYDHRGYIYSIKNTVKL